MSDELVEAVARAMAERNADLDEGVLQWQAWQDDARAAIAVVIERCAKVVDDHRPDASFDDSGSGAMERNALLDNVAAEIRALAANREG